MWYRQFISDFDLEGFKFNVYDAFVANRLIENWQSTIRLNVDNVLSSHVDPKINDDFAKLAQDKYGSIKYV